MYSIYSNLGNISSKSKKSADYFFDEVENGSIDTSVDIFSAVKCLRFDINEVLPIFYAITGSGETCRLEMFEVTPIVLGYINFRKSSFIITLLLMFNSFLIILKSSSVTNEC